MSVSLDESESTVGTLGREGKAAQENMEKKPEQKLSFLSVVHLALPFRVQSRKYVEFSRQNNQKAFTDTIQISYKSKKLAVGFPSSFFSIY